MRRRWRASWSRVPKINPLAVKRYLERKMDDWRWMKEVPREELEEVVDDLGYKFHTKPRNHQVPCFLLGSRFPRFSFLLDMGGGKSKILCDLMRFRHQRKELRCALVCVPNLINLPSWEDQLQTHAPELKYMVLDGHRQLRMSKLVRIKREKIKVCIINYAGLPVFMGKRGRTSKKASPVDKVLAQRFASYFNFLGLDETHLVLSSRQSVTFKLLDYLSPRMDYVYLTTGTLFGRDPTKAYPQLAIVDRGETLGTEEVLFKQAFFLPEENHFGVKWVFDRRQDKKLNRVLQHRSIRYEDSEFSDLPKLMPSVKIPVRLTEAQLARYEELVKESREARKRDEVKVVWAKLRQTASGFISVRGEDNTKLEATFDPNPMAEALSQFLLELPEDEKVVIWHEYIHTGKIIQNVLKKLKMSYAGVGSGFADVRLQRDTFMSSPSCRAFVANHKAGGTGADGLQRAARIQVFYETPTSPDRRRQCIKRLFRDGQLRRVHVYDLYAANVAIHKSILASLASGMDIFDSVCNGRKVDL